MNRGLLVALAIAFAAVAGFLAQRQLQPSVPAVAAGQTATTEVPVDATAAADAASAEPARKVPEVLPQFVLADRDGKKRSLKDWAGQPLMVNYWATWCGPCRREIPLLNQIRKQREKQRLEIIGIAVDFRDDVLKYAVENPIRYPLLIGEDDGLEAVKAMGMEPAFPFTVFADSKQNVVALKIGELHQDEADLILDTLVEVDTGKLALPTARTRITEGLKAIATRRAAAEAAK